MTLPKRLLALFLLLVGICSASAADLATGTWEYRGPHQSAMSLVSAQSGNTVRFQLEIDRGGPSHNTGWIEGQFELAGAKGIFQSTEYGACTIHFEFQRSAVVIKEGTDAVQNCGFGFNVFADGRLINKSRKVPKFTSGDPRGGGK